MPKSTAHVTGVKRKPMRSFLYKSTVRYSLLLISSFYIETAIGSSAAGQETLMGVVGRDFIMMGADSSKSSSITVTSNNVDKIRVLVDPFPNQNRRGIRHRIDEQQAIVVSSAGDAADIDRLTSTLTSHISMMEFEASIGCDVKCVYRGRGGMPMFPVPAGLDAESVARLARGQIASSLRSRGRLNACLLVAGMVRSSGTVLTRGESDDGTNKNVNESYFSRKIQNQVKAAQNEYSGYGENQTNIILPTTLEKSEERKRSSSFLQPRLYWLDEYGSIQSMEYCAHGLGSNFALSLLDRGYHEDMSRDEAATLIRHCFDQLRNRFIINSPESPCIKCIDKNGVHIFSDN